MKPTLLKQSRTKSIYQLTAEFDYKKGKTIESIAEELKVTEEEVRAWVS